jgi:hypothetical protein
MKSSILRILTVMALVTVAASFATAEELGAVPGLWPEASPSPVVDFEVHSVAFAERGGLEEIPAPAPPDVTLAPGSGGSRGGAARKSNTSSDAVQDAQGSNGLHGGKRSNNSWLECPCDTPGESSASQSCDVCSGCNWNDGWSGNECCGCEDCCNDDSCGANFVEIDNMFMRAHVNDDVVGKLREKYEYTPRIVLGYEGAGGVGARIRYWAYTHTTSAVDAPPNNRSLRFNFDVVDFEGTSRFSSKRADLVIAAGFRWANLEANQDLSNKVYGNMPGITFAADGRAALSNACDPRWFAVCGARWSMLGGDWKGDQSNSFIEATRDDNINVNELYGGFEYVRHGSNVDTFARIVFEMQNWRSDALANNSDTDSFSFVGPGIQVGGSF